MVSMLASLTLAAAALATGASAVLTPFGSEYDYMTMHLYEAFTKVLDETEHDITMGDLTFPRHFDRLDTLYAAAKDKTLVEKIYNETVPLVNAPWILFAPVAWTDVIFDTFEAIADKDDHKLQKLIQDEREATEERVMTRMSMEAIVFHLETFYRRVAKADDTLRERVNAEYNKIMDNAFATYDFNDKVEQFGRQSQ